ncbi:TetR/AcrR family transcriptional regulator [Halostreptopolyspora alba]|uniref:TetR family transcriptional regulator n=1 Tax=Halostreptopolyspora alba TaxID=2487137 RepID=A0A3N0EDC8_9ACTN|nr:TetR family transcriptional regulator [Nocardiopsaceae bacterium YIM 96095]
MGAVDQDADERGRTGRSGHREVVIAAVRLFCDSGYEATTMDDIAAATGVSRRSLFRHFGSKEDILFAEHYALFETVTRYLAASPGDDPVATVCAAARMVFQGYVGVPEITVPRYRLVRAVPRLRDREIAMTARYQNAFSRYLARGETDSQRILAGEALAASVIAAHNHVLRSWLHDPEQPVPWDRFDSAMAFVTASLGAVLRDPETRTAATP